MRRVRVCGPVQVNGILCRGPTQATLNPPSPPQQRTPNKGEPHAAGVERRNSHSLRYRPAQGAALQCSESKPASRPAPSGPHHSPYHTIAPCCRESNTRSLSCRESANSISIHKRVVGHADINPSMPPPRCGIKLGKEHPAFVVNQALHPHHTTGNPTHQP